MNPINKKRPYTGSHSENASGPEFCYWRALTTVHKPAMAHSPMFPRLADHCLKENKDKQSLKIQVGRQKQKKVTAAGLSHVSLRCPQMCVWWYTVGALRPCSCKSNWSSQFTRWNRRETLLFHFRENNSAHLLLFSWRMLFACSGSMCTNLVTKECPSPWLKQTEIKWVSDLTTDVTTWRALAPWPLL